MTIPADIRSTLVALLEATHAQHPTSIPPGHAERITALLAAEFPDLRLMRRDDGFYLLDSVGRDSTPMRLLRGAVGPRAFSPAALPGRRGRWGPDYRPDRVKNARPVKP